MGGKNPFCAYRQFLYSWPSFPDQSERVEVRTAGKSFEEKDIKVLVVCFDDGGCGGKDAVLIEGGISLINSDDEACGSSADF